MLFRLSNSGVAFFGFVIGAIGEWLEVTSFPVAS